MDGIFKFEFKPQEVRFDELRTHDFDWFKSNPNFLCASYDDALSPYYDIYKQRGVKPFYHLSPTYNTVMNDTHFRYLIVRFGGDKVFVPYKVIQILKTKQIRFFNKPVSRDGNTEHENAVFYKLNSLDFVKFVLTESERMDGYEPLVEYDDYYFTLDDKDHKYNSSKYRSKNYINQIFSNKDVTLEYGCTADAKQLLSLYEVWKNGMIKNGSVVTKSNDKQFTDLMFSTNIKIQYIVIYYKSRPISCQSFILEKEHGYCDCLFIHHIWDDDGDKILHRITQNITEIQKYMCHYFLYLREGIQTVYIAGCRPSEHRLLKHKQRISDGKIAYYLSNKKS